MIKFKFNFTKSLKGELKEIDSLVYSVSQGDLTKTLDFHSKHAKNLYGNLNNLIKVLRGLIAQIITISDKTINFTFEIKNDAESIKSSSKQNSNIIYNISKDMEEQISQVKEAKDYSTEIKHAAEKVAQESDNIKQMEFSNLQTVTDSYKDFQLLIDKMEKTALSNINTNTKIKSLEEKTKLIENIAEQVSKISKNTNLLALNASIEAARAGESGKGFSVVAVEVSKLAESSTLQAKQIEAIVSGIKKEITDISLSIEKDITDIKEYIQFSHITKQHLDKIKSDTKNTFDAFIKIDSALEEQVDKISKVDNIVLKVYNTFENLSNTTAEIAAASEEEAHITEDIFTKLMNLSSMNTEIKHYVSSFIKNYKINSQKQLYINEAVGTLKKIATIYELTTMDYAITTPLLTEQLNNHPYFELLALMDNNGLRKAITLNYAENEVYVNFSHRPYFKEAMAGRDFISEPYISVDTNNYCLAISVPIKKNKEIVGILMADLKL